MHDKLVHVDELVLDMGLLIEPHHVIVQLAESEVGVVDAGMVINLLSHIVEWGTTSRVHSERLIDVHAVNSGVIVVNSSSYWHTSAVFLARYLVEKRVDCQHALEITVVTTQVTHLVTCDLPELREAVLSSERIHCNWRQHD